MKLILYKNGTPVPGTEIELHDTPYPGTFSLSTWKVETKHLETSDPKRRDGKQ